MYSGNGISPLRVEPLRRISYTQVGIKIKIKRWARLGLATLRPSG